MYNLNLMYLTNKESIARIAEKSGVDWIFVDLEVNGKYQRQGHLNTVISKHQIEDVSKIKKVLNKSKLLVRVNPIYKGSENEIKRVISDGADIVMLPFFKQKKEVERFLELVDGKAKTCLLFETPEAVEQSEKILELDGIDYAHIGLNDLHLGYNMNFMFEPLANGMVQALIEKFKNKQIEYGFGGIARIGFGDLPSEWIVTEHYRLGSKMAILSRSFYQTNDNDDDAYIQSVFEKGVQDVRKLEAELSEQDIKFLEKNKQRLTSKIFSISNEIYLKRIGKKVGVA